MKIEVYVYLLVVEVFCSLKIFCQDERFQYECDVLQRLDYVEKKLKESEKLISTLEDKAKESSELISTLEHKAVESSELIAELQDRVKRTEDENAELTTKLQEQLGSTAVAFTAAVGGAPGYIIVGQGQTIVYNNVITNIGGGYNNQTGIFTAPVSGLYVFDFAEMIDPGHYEYLHLVKDGTHVISNYGHASGADHLVSSSRVATVEVDKGSQVWVRTPNIAGHGTGKIHGWSYTTFSGWLVV